MTDNKQKPGDVIEDDYYASGGVRTGSAYSEYIVSQKKQGGSGGGSPGNGGGDGCGLMLVVAFILFASSYFIVSGYVLSVELVAHYWSGYSLKDHNWYIVGLYAGCSIGAVALVARFWGLLLGILIGLIPTMPLYYSTKGGVGFWYIVHNGGKDLMDNVFSSWIALIGMISLHGLIAWYCRPDAGQSPWTRVVRWTWIRTSSGIVATCILVCASSVVIYIIEKALGNF